MNIISLLEQIQEDEIVLPDIQRDFVWDEARIEKLFDSIMRGYPIGLVLLWETHNDLQYRKFEKNYKPTIKYNYYNNEKNKRIKLVLDGQQRLQSLYVSLYGSYKGKNLYFDILSGMDSDDFSEDKYIFEFYELKEVEKLNINLKEKMDKFKDIKNMVYYHKVIDLINMSPKRKQSFIKKIIDEFNLTDEQEMRIRQNIDNLKYVFTTNQDILKATIIDSNLPRNSPDRKSESDVLEAFVRINRQGIRLNRSDLIFSFLKLNWSESAVYLPEFIEEINEGNAFDIDLDFVIRCLFAVSDFGSKFDVNLLRNKKNVEKIRNNYEKCCDAIRSTLDFIQTECWISSSKLLGGYYNIVPFVYYVYHLKNYQIPNKEIDNVRKALYLFGFTSPFSRYADSRLGRFIKDELKSGFDKGSKMFPLGDAVWWVWYWERISNYGSELINGNPSLAMHLIQRRSGTKILYEKNEPQIDHIFPRSTLRKMKYDEAEINHFANFWILAKDKNQNKSNKDPKLYFTSVSNSVLKRAYIDKKLLSYDKYRTFLQTREEKILKKIKKELYLKKNDYNVKSYYTVD